MIARQGVSPPAAEPSENACKTLRFFPNVPEWSSPRHPLGRHGLNSASRALPPTVQEEPFMAGDQIPTT